jgi:hypothetical protein
MPDINSTAEWLGECAHADNRNQSLIRGHATAPAAKVTLEKLLDSNAGELSASNTRLVMGLVALTKFPTGSVVFWQPVVPGSSDTCRSEHTRLDDKTPELHCATMTEPEQFDPLTDAVKAYVPGKLRRHMHAGASRVCFSCGRQYMLHAHEQGGR